MMRLQAREVHEEEANLSPSASAANGNSVLLWEKKNMVTVAAEIL